MTSIVQSNENNLFLSNESYDETQDIIGIHLFLIRIKSLQAIFNVNIIIIFFHQLLHQTQPIDNLEKE